MLRETSKMPTNQYHNDELLNQAYELNNSATTEDSFMADRSRTNQTMDRFYANAVYCMLAIYRNKYQQKLEGNDQLNETVWHEISQEMKDSYFEFEYNEIKEKFKQLRKRYFSIETLQQRRNFEYFEAMHEIYQLPGSMQMRQVHADEILIQETAADSISINETTAELDLKDMTFQEFNAQQQRRHNEQMHLWQQMLRQQSTLIEQQKLLIEQLLKQI